MNTAGRAGPSPVGGGWALEGAAGGGRRRRVSKTAVPHGPAIMAAAACQKGGMKTSSESCRTIRVMPHHSSHAAPSESCRTIRVMPHHPSHAAPSESCRTIRVMPSCTERDGDSDPDTIMLSRMGDSGGVEGPGWRVRYSKRCVRAVPVLVLLLLLCVCVCCCSCYGPLCLPARTDVQVGPLQPAPVPSRHGDSDPARHSSRALQHTSESFRTIQVIRVIRVIQVIRVIDSIDEDRGRHPSHPSQSSASHRSPVTLVQTIQSFNAPAILAPRVESPINPCQHPITPPHPPSPAAPAPAGRRRRGPARPP